MHTHDDTAQYTVGWIAPLPLELTAAKGMLDNLTTKRVPHDNALYHVGQIGVHSVVMVVCPNMGTEPAATVLANMLRSFPNIKHILVVGIAGGVPCYGPGLQEQICLGDVVVGVPQKGSGGVTHYEFGAYEGQGELKVKSHTLHPSSALLTAVNNLQSAHMGVVPYKIPQFLQQLRMNVNQVSRKDYEDPGEDHDHLYEDNYDHPDPNRSCQEVCDRWNQGRARWTRGSGIHREIDHPRIHYGTIGSANAIVRSSAKRNQLREKHGIICLEMEAAGIISSYQGLVIRGICDYVDSYKNKLWQGYAAAIAAAYVRELLLHLPASADSSCGEPVSTRPSREKSAKKKSPVREMPLVRLEPPMPPIRVEPPMPPVRVEPPASNISHESKMGINLGWPGLGGFFQNRFNFQHGIQLPRPRMVFFSNNIFQPLSVVTQPLTAVTEFFFNAYHSKINFMRNLIPW